MLKKATLMLAAALVATSALQAAVLITETPVDASALPGYTSVDFTVTPDIGEQFVLSEITVALTAGTIYYDGFAAGVTPPNPLFVASFPTLGLTTHYGVFGEGWAEAPGTAQSPTALSVTPYDDPAAPDFSGAAMQLFRLTVSDDAEGTITFGTQFAASGANPGAPQVDVFTIGAAGPVDTADAGGPYGEGDWVSTSWNDPANSIALAGAISGADAAAWSITDPDGATTALALVGPTPTLTIGDLLAAGVALPADGSDPARMAYTLTLENGTASDTAAITVPEPASMSLLALGALALIRRRRA